MPTLEYRLTFPEAPKGIRNTIATKIKEKLDSLAKDSTYSADARVEKDDNSTMDFGATLVVVLAAPSVVILAKAIRDVLTNEGQSSFQYNGNSFSNIRSKDVAEIVRELTDAAN